MQHFANPKCQAIECALSDACNARAAFYKSESALGRPNSDPVDVSSSRMTAITAITAGPHDTSCQTDPEDLGTCTVLPSTLEHMCSSALRLTVTGVTGRP